MRNVLSHHNFLGAMISSITLDKEVIWLLNAWDTEQLTATVLPADAWNKKLIWTSSDTSIATVDQTGLVTCVTPGNCTITCTAKYWWASATASVVWSMLVVEYLLIGWGWGWNNTWTSAYAGWGGWGWEALTWTLCMLSSECIVIWSWWWQNSWWWASCIWELLVARWWCRGNWYTWWNSWSWFRWCWWYVSDTAGWWAWACWNAVCNPRWSYYYYWWNWWKWICSDITWVTACYAWGWWWWQDYYNNCEMYKWCGCDWGWNWWWWRWRSWTAATTCWAWWGWNTYEWSWWRWGNWLAVFRYPTACWYNVTGWCKYTCWDYTIHCFTESWCLELE